MLIMIVLYIGSQDFGFRGCTSVEQSILGGTAHLLSFTGSDTMSAAYYAQVRACACVHVRKREGARV